MRQYIEVKQHTPPAGQEYMATSFPGPGIYQSPTTLTWYAVYSGMAMTLGTGTSCPIPLVGDINVFDEAEAISTIAEPAITADHLLKLVAIMQNPNLAKELTK